MSAIAHLLNTTLEVRRRHVASDGMGGQTVAWQRIGTVPGRVSRPPTSTTNAVLSAAQTMERIPYYVYLEADAEVYRGDVLVDSEDDRELFVESISRPSVKAFQQAGVRETQVEPQAQSGP